MNPKTLILLLVLGTALATGGVTLFVYDTVQGNLPSLEVLENPPQNLATQLFSSDGKLLDQYFKEKRVILKKSEIPPSFINALIATEDREFYSHWGLHLERIFKAAIKNVFMGKREGASTLTQQLSRNLFYDRSISAKRKILEAFAAIKIESVYTKDEIITMYANTVAFGRGAYGIRVAAKSFFDKEPKELSVAECAYLVAQLKAPTHYDASRNYERALARRNLVLRMMRDEGFLTNEEYYSYSEDPIIINERQSKKDYLGVAPHFVEDIRQFMSSSPLFEDYDLYTDGLTINTTLNYKIQKYANEAVEEHLIPLQEQFDKAFSWNRRQKLLDKLISEAIRKRPDYISASKEKREQIATKLKKDDKFIDSVKNVSTTIQIGVTVLNPNTGEILAMVGASPKFLKENLFSKYSLNHVSRIKRQPGSSIKPFVYALALQEGMRPDDLIKCGPFTYIDPVTNQSWSPRTGADDCDSETEITLQEGLRRSINSVAARLITQVTNPIDVRDLLYRAGIKSKIQAVPALALGAGGEISPLELASAYSIFVNNGYHCEPFYLTKVSAPNGSTLLRQERSSKLSDAMDKLYAQMTTQMMRSVVDAGTAAGVRRIFPIQYPAAGKTGTTNDNADAWFVGVTPDLVACVWVGFDDQRINFDIIGRYGQGGRAAAPVWALLMKKIYEDTTLGYSIKQFDTSAMDNGTEHEEETVIQ